HSLTTRRSSDLGAGVQRPADARLRERGHAGDRGMSEHRDLGMHRRIPRRDFLNGVAIGIAGLGLRGSGGDLLAQETASYPPAFAGLRGNYPDAVRAFGP